MNEYLYPSESLSFLTGVFYVNQIWALQVHIFFSRYGAEYPFPSVFSGYAEADAGGIFDICERMIRTTDLKIVD